MTHQTKKMCQIVIKSGQTWKCHGNQSIFRQFNVQQPCKSICLPNQHPSWMPGWTFTKQVLILWCTGIKHNALGLKK